MGIQRYPGNKRRKKEALASPSPWRKFSAINIYLVPTLNLSFLFFFFYERHKHMYTNLETLRRCQKNRENEKTDVYICEKVKGIDEIKGHRIKRMKREIYN